VGSVQHVFFFHSLLSLVISMLTAFILLSSFTQSIHLFLGRPLLGCPSTFIFITIFGVWFSFLRITCPYQVNLFSFLGLQFPVWVSPKFGWKLRRVGWDTHNERGPEEALIIRRSILVDTRRSESITYLTASIAWVIILAFAMKSPMYITILFNHN
jgi:hypothetical protein